MRFYPEGACEEAEEVGPCTEKAGPCMVRFSGSRLTPAELNAWIEAGSSTSAAIVRAYWLGPNPGEAGSQEELLAQLLEAGPAPGGAPLRLQCFPKSLESWLGEELPLEFNLQPVGPKWVLNIVCSPVDGGEPIGQGGEEPEGRRHGGDAAAAAGDRQQACQQGSQQQEQQQAAGAAAEQQHDAQRRQPRQRFLWSMQPASTLYNYAPVKTKRVPNQLSKAAGKLAEALQASGVQLTTGVAIDLGAAPGGWTHVLAQHARRVIAVDPAALDPRALASTAVTHLACKAEDAVEEIRRLVGEAGVDLLVSDVNRHPVQLIELMRPLLPLLHPGGAVIATLKFYGRAAGREEEWCQKLADALGPDFEGVRLVWLLANTQHEQTMVAFKKAATEVTGGQADSTSAQGQL